MTQLRYMNFGSPVSASSINAMHSGLSNKGLLKGGEVSISGTNTVAVNPLWVIFGSGVILQETDIQQLVVPYSSTNRTFTISYRHTDGGLIGGNAATLQVEPGFLSNENPMFLNGVALAYIGYPGSGPLLETHIMPAQHIAMGIPFNEGQGAFYVPPYVSGQTSGFMQMSQFPVSPVITPTNQDASVAASYVYTNGGGGVTFTANLAGVGGNKISISLINDVSVANRSLSVVFSAPTTFTVYLEKAGGTLLTTMSGLVTALAADTNFSALATAVVTGVSSTVVAPASFLLFGGMSDAGYSYKINNTSGFDMTHVLKWAFVARSSLAKTVILEFYLSSASNSITTLVTDTDGGICTLSAVRPDVLQPSSGLTRRSLRITNGNFVPGHRYFVQATVFTKAGQSSTISLFGVSEYSLPF